MNNHFGITYKDVHIQVEGGESDSYVLKYPDGKFIMIDKGEKDWVVEDRSGDYWSDEDIQAIGILLAQNDPGMQGDTDE